MKAKLLPLAALMAVAFCSTTYAQRPDRDPRGPDRSPSIGQLAPDFELVLLDKTGATTTNKVKLSDLRGRQPVVLIFGSYT